MRLMCSGSGDWLVIAVRDRGIVEAWMSVIWWVGEILVVWVVTVVSCVGRYLELFLSSLESSLQSESLKKKFG